MGAGDLCKIHDKFEVSNKQKIVRNWGFNFYFPPPPLLANTVLYVCRVFDSKLKNNDIYQK